MVDVAKESVGEVYNGHKTVGTTAVKLTDLSFPMLKGVLLRCPGGSDPVGNSVPVWVGGRGVTADSAATGGVPILPGNSIFIPIERANLLWVVSSSADQDVAWLGI